MCDGVGRWPGVPKSLRGHHCPGAERGARAPPGPSQLWGLPVPGARLAFSFSAEVSLCVCSQPAVPKPLAVLRSLWGRRDAGGVVGLPPPARQSLCSAPAGGLHAPRVSQVESIHAAVLTCVSWPPRRSGASWNVCHMDAFSCEMPARKSAVHLCGCRSS